MWWLLWIGCDGRGFMTKPDIGMETGSVDVDTEPDSDDPGTGDAEINLQLFAMGSVVSCERAGVSEISLDFLGDTLVVPCDGGPIAWYSVSAGTGALTGTADSVSGAVYGGSVEVTVLPDESNVIALDLLCDETVVLDGCGQAEEG